MKRIYVYIIVLGLVPVAVIGALFFINGPNGEPLMNMERLRKTFQGEWSLARKVKLIGQDAAEKADVISEKAREYLPSKDSVRFDTPIETPQETLFKWRGKDGKWHYSNQLPPDREEFEVVD